MPETPAALLTVAAETERHVASGGWDQPPRLFALVPTADLLAREPQLRAPEQQGQADPDALSAVEQDGIPATADLQELLAGIGWPAPVAGCALAVERFVVPPAAQQQLPADPDAAVQALLAHPGRRDVRLLVAVLRDGSATCLLRQREHDRDDEVAVGQDLAPGLVSALLATLAE